MDTLALIDELIKTGEALVPIGGGSYYNGDRQPDYVAWRLQVISALEELGSVAKPLLKDIEADKRGPWFFKASASRLLGALKAASAIAKRKPSDTGAILTPAPLPEATANKIFIVHGHEETLLHQVARFVERLQIEPIILFEQPGKGRTIIEKLEANSAVSFAVILFTPDDLGRAAKEDAELKPIARQNVVLELGYFVGRLNRSHVAVLHDESVELPSDYHGVEYIRVDPSGAWKLKLAKEIKAAGLSIDMNNAV